MNRVTGFFLFVCLQLILCVPSHAFVQRESVQWSSSATQHVYGLPGIQAKEKGTLSITATGLTFAGKTGSAAIPLASIIAVNSGDQRVELWGTKGRLLRMAIPNGGGLVAATFMHHRVDMLTVEFSDSQGGYHGAVFFLPANEADRALRNLTAVPASHRETGIHSCENTPVTPQTVRVFVPDWNQIDVPAAYRALVYERLVDRLRQSKGIQYVYRDGEPGCSQFTVQLAVKNFEPGSQVKRASMGPVGMFVSTTQMAFDLKFIAEGKPEFHDQIKATIRGESESTNVAGQIAKKATKQFEQFQKQSAAAQPQSR